jgi:hypothetical protein
MILAVAEVFDQQAAFSKDGSKYTRTFEVLLDSYYLGPYQAANAGYPIPQPGDVFPLDSEAYVVSASVEAAFGDKKPLYLVTVNYDTAIDNPYLEPPQIQWSTKTYSKAVTVDALYGYAITSSAGEPFVPPQEEDFYNIVCTITRNEPAFDASLQGMYCGCVNTDYVWIGNLFVAPGAAMVRDINGVWTVKRLLGAEWTYWSVTYTVEMDINTYVRYLLDHGTYYIDGLGERVSFMDGDNLADRPKLLDGSGAPLADGLDAVYGVFYTRPGIAFSPLLLGYSVW